MIPVLARHEGLVVADKPSGLPSTGRDLDDPDCVQGQLMAQLRRRKLWAVHQLDKATSGLNLFVERKALVALWGDRLRPPGGDKRYLAFCHGAWEGGPRRVDLALGRGRDADGREVPRIDPRGRAATSLVAPIVTAGAHCLLAVRPLTGRTHQVRLHLAALGHPVVGEPLHRDPPCALHPRLALHAHQLRFAAAPPELRRLVAPLPPDLRALAARLHLALPADLDDARYEPAASFLSEPSGTA